MLQDAPAGKDGRALPASAWRGLFITVATTLFSWAFALVCYWRGLPKPYSWPYYVLNQTAEFPHGDRFGDFQLFSDQMPNLHTAQFFTGMHLFNYPPASAIFFRLLTLPVQHAVLFYLLLVVLALLAAARFLAGRLGQLGVAPGVVFGFIAGTVLFSYPLQFELHRANLEFVIVVFTATGLWSIARGRYTLAAVLLGLAASMKWFPFILFGLFLPLRRYRDFALAWGVMAAATLAGLWAETPSLAMSIEGTRRGMLMFANYATAALNPNIGYDHGVFALVKVLTGGAAASGSSVYLLCGGLAAGLLYLVRIWRLPLLNQVLALVLCSVLLPPFSADYTLLHLYCPWALILLSLVRGRLLPSAGRAASLLLAGCGLVFGLQSFLIVHGTLYAAQCKCLVLLAMLAVTLVEPLRESPAEGDGRTDGIAPLSPYSAVPPQSR